MKKQIRNIILLSSACAVFTACGGGGGSSSSGGTSNLSAIVNQSDPTQFDNEPFFKYAWHLTSKNNNFSNDFNININSHINVKRAWDLTTGVYKVGSLKDQAVKVAVIDDNFDINHEDLKDNVIAYRNFDANPDDNNVLPQNGQYSHGTSVTSFIAASANQKGLVGVAPDVKLILIKQEYISDSRTIAAFEYAKSQGAKVINCSWGTANGPSQALSDKIQELKNEGINIVFASGNDNKDLDVASNDESELDSVIGVGSSNASNERSVYSNYGSKIDVLAPGGDLNSGKPGVLGAFVPNTETNTKDPITHNYNIDSNNYSFTQGTSFSAPITSGVIALMLSVNPKLNPDEIRTILIETADKIGSGTNYSDIFNDGTSSTFDRYNAYGKINAYKAVKRAKDQYVP